VAEEKSEPVVTYGTLNDAIYFVRSPRVRGHSNCRGQYGCGALVPDPYLERHKQEHRNDAHDVIAL
jgi:hypothetical protein